MQEVDACVEAMKARGKLCPGGDAKEDIAVGASFSRERHCLGAALREASQENCRLAATVGGVNANDSCVGG